MEPAGVWFENFEALTGSTGIIGAIAIDLAHIKTYRCVAGGKGGASVRPLARGPDNEDPRADRPRRA